MSASRRTTAQRLWALFSFLLAAGLYLFAQTIAASAANGLSSGLANPLAYSCVLLFLLLTFYWAMGFALQRQRTPLRSMGIIRRQTAPAEFGLGAAIGWSGMVACVLPIALLGGITVTFWTSGRQFGLLVLDTAVLLVASLVEEVAHRGYPFQRLIEAIGPVMATLVLSGIFALEHLGNPGADLGSTVVTMLAGWLFAIAYLRTRALWLPWGLHFAWNASMCLLFGLPVSGRRDLSPVISSNAHGPFWLTGDGYGPEGGSIAIFVLLALIGFLYYFTRDYAYDYAQPVVVPGGMPVEIEAAANRLHEEAMASPAAISAPTLIQIQPAPSIRNAGDAFPPKRSAEEEQE